MPFLMQATMSYTEIGIFTLAGYPYSFKLLWSPIVDTVYSRRIGRRKSWIIPLQTTAAFAMILYGEWVESRLKEGNAVSVTILFFFLVLIAATQDIAVDGWALTLLSKENVGYAATCQTIGMNIGYFSSFTVFLALNDPSFCSKYLGSPSGQGLVSLHGYLRFWGWLYLLITVAVALLKKEKPFSPSTTKKSSNINSASEPFDSLSHGEYSSMRRRPSRRSTVEELNFTFSKEEADSNGSLHKGRQNSLKDAYFQLWRVIKLPSVQLLALMLFLSRFGALAAESVAALKLLEKGASKEALGGLVLVEFPIEILSAIVAGRWAASTHPLRPWLAGYRLRLLVAAGTVLAVWFFPLGASMPSDAPFSFLMLGILGIMTSFASTLMFTSIGDFYNRICDPSMGGAYLTLLNTIANFGVVVPKLGIFAAIDFLTVRRCLKATSREEEMDFMIESEPNRYPKKWLDAQCGPASSHDSMDSACNSAGGECVVIRDGFYVLATATILLGWLLMFFIRSVVLKMEKLPPSAWRTNAR